MPLEHTESWGWGRPRAGAMMKMRLRFYVNQREIERGRKLMNVRIQLPTFFYTFSGQIKL